MKNEGPQFILAVHPLVQNLRSTGENFPLREQEYVETKGKTAGEGGDLSQDPPF